MFFSCFFIHRDSVHFSRKNMVEATMRQPWMSYQIRLVMIIVDELPDDAVLKGKNHGKINFLWTLTSFLKPQDKGLSAWVAGCIYFHIYTYYIHIIYIYTYTSYIKFRCITHIDTLEIPLFSVVVQKIPSSVNFSWTMGFLRRKIHPSPYKMQIWRWLGSRESSMGFLIVQVCPGWLGIIQVSQMEKNKHDLRSNSFKMKMKVGYQ